MAPDVPGTRPTSFYDKLSKFKFCPCFVTLRLVYLLYHVKHFPPHSQLEAIHRDINDAKAKLNLCPKLIYTSVILEISGNKHNDVTVLLNV